jgi:hypothetical protein
MIIPKVIFRYSRIYDQTWRKGLINNKVKNYPSRRQILNYIKKVEKLWRKDERKILRELSKIAHLKWKSKTIACYVVGKCIPFSDPLIIPVYKKYPDYFIDVLVHELIHNLFVQNYEKTRAAWSYFERKYRKEPQKTKIHIPLHAIHFHIYLKFYNEKRLKRDIKLISHLPAYKKSWQIVQRQGYQNIIREFVERIK